MWDLVGNPEDRFSHNEAQINLDTQAEIVVEEQIAGAVSGLQILSNEAVCLVENIANH